MLLVIRMLVEAACPFYGCSSYSNGIPSYDINTNQNGQQQGVVGSNLQQYGVWNSSAAFSSSRNSATSVQNVPLTSNGAEAVSASQGPVQSQAWQRNGSMNFLNSQTGTTLPPGQPGYLPIYAGDKHTYTGRIQDVQSMDAPFYESIGRPYV
ncbi:unnamed protein product [Toxocara canis]|uniref:Secreted protein n=1 Tax=Toxocara canis TaxID=6265 RepID=A0A183V4Y2_TOXCA|nr:unnamed protein product [Toxocara canis]